jgi:hypothetical protein
MNAASLIFLTIGIILLILFAAINLPKEDTNDSRTGSVKNNNKKAGSGAAGGPDSPASDKATETQRATEKG